MMRAYTFNSFTIHRFRIHAPKKAFSDIICSVCVKGGAGELDLFSTLGL